MTYESGVRVVDLLPSFKLCPPVTFHSSAEMEEKNLSSLLVLFSILSKGIFRNRMVKSNTYKNINKRKEDAIKLFFWENQITMNRLILDFLIRLFAVRA